MQCSVLYSIPYHLHHVYNMLHVMSYYTILFYITPYDIALYFYYILHYILFYYVMLYYSISCDVMLYFIIYLYYTLYIIHYAYVVMLFYVTLCCLTLWSITLYIFRLLMRWGRTVSSMQDLGKCSGNVEWCNIFIFLWN